MKIIIESLEVSIQTKENSLIFRKDKEEKEVWVKPSGYKERRFIRADENSLSPWSFRYRAATLAVEDKIISWFECRKEGEEE